MSRLGDMLHFVPQSSTFVASYADFMEGTGSAGIAYTDVINLAKYRKVLYVIQKGAGASATGVVTVESCDNVTPSTPTAIAYHYKVCTTIDTYGDWVSVASTGFTTTAGANQCYLVEVDASELSGTDKYCRLKITETVDAACDGCVLTILGSPRVMLENCITSLT